MAQAGPPAGGAPKEQGAPNAFKLIRNAPVEESSSAGLMMVVAGLLVAVAIGGAIMLRRPSGDAGQPGQSGGQTPTPPPVTPAPDFVIGQIEFLENEGQLKAALEKAESYRTEYPNSPELEMKIKSLRQRLGLEEGPGATRAVGQLLSDARRQATEGKLDEALETVDRALDANPESAEALFLKGDIMAAQGNKLDATGAYEAARDAGFDSDQVDAAIKRLR